LWASSVIASAQATHAHCLRCRNPVEKSIAAILHVARLNSYKLNFGLFSYIGHVFIAYVCFRGVLVVAGGDIYEPD
jgi:hypothetical protein